MVKHYFNVLSTATWYNMCFMHSHMEIKEMRCILMMNPQMKGYFEEMTLKSLIDISLMEADCPDKMVNWNFETLNTHINASKNF